MVLHINYLMTLLNHVLDRCLNECSACGHKEALKGFCSFEKITYIDNTCAYILDIKLVPDCLMSY